MNIRRKCLCSIGPICFLCVQAGHSYHQSKPEPVYDLAIRESIQRQEHHLPRGGGFPLSVQPLSSTTASATVSFALYLGPAFTPVAVVPDTSTENEYDPTPIREPRQIIAPDDKSSC